MYEQMHICYNLLVDDSFWPKNSLHYLNIKVTDEPFQKSSKNITSNIMYQSPG